MFFLLSTSFTVVFGGIDLTLSHPRFFRLEPFVQNFLMGTVFLVSYLAKIPLFERLASELPEKLRPRQALPQGYLRKLSLVWMSYTYLKALAYLVLATQVNLGALILLRTVLGSSTLFLMFLLEILYRKKVLARSHPGKEG